MLALNVFSELTYTSNVQCTVAERFDNVKPSGTLSSLSLSLLQLSMSLSLVLLSASLFTCELLMELLHPRIAIVADKALFYYNDRDFFLLPILLCAHLRSVADVIQS